MYSGMRNERHLKLIRRVAVGLLFLPLPIMAQRREMSGYITARDGTPIEGVSVVTSGMGFNGWATSETDGSFRLSAGGWPTLAFDFCWLILNEAAPPSAPFREWEPMRPASRGFPINLSYTRRANDKVKISERLRHRLPPSEKRRG